MVSKKHLFVALPLAVGLVLPPAAYAAHPDHHGDRHGGLFHGDFRAAHPDFHGDWRGRDWDGHHHGNAATAAIIGGLIGLGVGAAIAGHSYPPYRGY